METGVGEDWADVVYGLLQNGVAVNGVRAVEVADVEVDVVDGIVEKLLWLK